MSKFEKRTCRDMGPPLSRSTDATTTTDATPTAATVRLLREAVQRLDASLDRAAERIEDARQVKAALVEEVRQASTTERLSALIEESATNIFAEDLRAARRDENERFERKLFGRRLPRDIAESVFGFEEEPN